MFKLAHLATIVLTILPLVQASTYPYPNFHYDPTPEAVLVFGAPTPKNKAAIAALSSNNEKMVTWTKSGQLLSAVPHPIATSNQDTTFMDCLFFQDKSPLITDFYLDMMLKAVKSAKMVLLVDSLEELPHLLEWFTMIIKNSKLFNSTLLVTATERKALDFQLIPNGVAVSWDIPSAIEKLAGIVSTIVLPQDVSLITEHDHTQVDDILSSITSSIILSFNKTLTYLEATLPTITDESFTDRLRTLDQMKNVLKRTEEQVKNVDNFTAAAEKIDVNMRSIGLIVGPEFKRDVSLGEEILRHIQAETGRELGGVKRLTEGFHGLINTTSHVTTRYVKFSQLFEELQDAESLRERRQDNFENLMEILEKNNETLDSALARKGRSFLNYHKGLLSRTRFPLSKLRKNTLYKMHLEADPSCFLTTDDVTVPKSDGCSSYDEILDDDRVGYKPWVWPTPIVACSQADKEKLYNEPQSTWFLDDEKILWNLKKGTAGFNSINYFLCYHPSSHAPTIYYIILMDSARDSSEKLNLSNDYNAEFRIYPSSNGHDDDNNVMVQQAYDGLSRARFERKAGSTPLFRLTPAMTLKSKLSGFQIIETASVSPTRKNFAESFTIVNKGSSTITRSITLTEKTTNTFALGFQQELTIGGKATLEGGVSFPLLADAKATVELSTELRQGSTKEWTQEESKDFTINYELSVPANTKAHISAFYEKLDDVRLPFKTLIQLSGGVSRINKYKDLILDVPAGGTEIKDYLEVGGWRAKFLRVEDDYVEYELYGELKASVGFSGQIEVDSEPLNKW